MKKLLSVISHLELQSSTKIDGFSAPLLNCFSEYGWTTACSIKENICKIGHTT